ncbi:DUF3900 domain-containing protein [Alkalicoccus luteus]|uniref:DUF3900 domain-containing protein n=1 Tax=Alkalicoccus luteus TaxID=1237094 RepID=UPI004034021D
MDMHVQFVSFFTVQSGEGSVRQARLEQTVTASEYAGSALESFLHEEFRKMLKRKADRNPTSHKSATKVGQFIVEDGYELGSNPNYAMLENLRQAASAEALEKAAVRLADAYAGTNSARGGILMLVQLTVTEWSSQPFVLAAKCDFEDHIVTVGSSEGELLRQVNRAISTKGMKAVQFPHMPQEGMIEPWEVKIHQASHASYFEDFLPYVGYPETKREAAAVAVIESAREAVLSEFEDDSEERIAEEKVLEAWANTEERTLQNRWDEEQVREVSRPILDRNPEVKLKLKLDHMKIEGLLEDFGERLHIARKDDRYVIVLEGEAFSFDKEASPVEFLQPDDMAAVFERILAKAPFDSGQ